MRDVVRTTVLSKRWKDLWTTVPVLSFRNDASDLVGFRNFVNRALMLWKGTKILKFVVYLRYQPSASSDLNLWLRVALENEVEELHLYLDSFGRYDANYRPPERLYSCSSIRKLSISFCNLKIHGNVHWDQLKCLTIGGVCLSEQVINQVLFGAPQLENLNLILIKSQENLNIQSNSLRKLKIYKSCTGGDDDDRPMDKVLRIWAPKVEKLEISGGLYRNYLLSNVSSLTDVNLDVSRPRYHGNDKFSWYAFHGQILMPVFQSIHHVEKVTLSDWCVKVLGKMKKTHDQLLPLSDAKSFKLYGIKANKMLNLLELFPQLTMLVLEFPNLWAVKGNIFLQEEDIEEPVVLKFDEENPLKSKTNFPKSALQHLRTVEIAWNARDTSIYPFIEFLLKHACNLEKMVFRVAGMSSVARESLFLPAQKLLSMPRSSPTAEVIFREY